MSTDLQIVEFEDDRTWLEAESLWLGQMREAASWVEPTGRQASQDTAAVTRAAIDRRLALWTARGRSSGIDRLCVGLDIGDSERWILRTLAAVRVQRDLLVEARFVLNPVTVDELAKFVGGPFTAASGDLLKYLRPGAPLVARRWLRTFTDPIGDLAVEITDQALAVVVGAQAPLATSMYSTVSDNIGAMVVSPAATVAAPRRPTGVADVDAALGGGLAPGELVLLAGCEAVGKTVVALGLAWRMARGGSATLFCANEYRLVDLARRLAKLIVPDLGQANADAYAPQFARLAHRLEKSQFAFDAHGMDTAMIADRCAAIAEQKGPLALVVVDSLPRAEVWWGGPLGACGALKRLAVELRAPVIVTSRVPLAVAMRADKRPRPVDLRLSGPEFEAVDVFMCLYRDECYEPDSEMPGMMEIAAHRRRGVTRALTPFDAESGRVGPPEAWER